MIPLLPGPSFHTLLYKHILAVEPQTKPHESAGLNKQLPPPGKEQLKKRRKRGTRMIPRTEPQTGTKPFIRSDQSVLFLFLFLIKISYLLLCDSSDVYAMRLEPRRHHPSSRFPANTTEKHSAVSRCLYSRPYRTPGCFVFSLRLCLSSVDWLSDLLQNIYQGWGRGRQINVMEALLTREQRVCQTQRRGDERKMRR